VADARGVSIEDRARAIEYVRLAAHHHREFTVARAFDPAGHRCVEKMDVVRGEHGGGAPGGVDRYRRVVDDDGTRMQQVGQAFDVGEHVGVERHA
jgi:hypothetical protein